MTNRPFRPFDFDRDLKAVQRIWIECGWIDDEDDERFAAIKQEAEQDLEALKQ